MDKTITRLLAFFIFFSSFAAQGQTCGKRGSNTSLPGWVKSGQEALRSDTTDVLHYHINLDFTQIASTLLTASCNVEHRMLENTDGISLDLLSMTIDSVKIDGQLTTYSYNDTLLRVHYPTTPAVGDTLEAMVYYHGTPQQDPSGFGGFYFMSGYFFNLGVAFQSIPHNYGRVWHPCFDNFVERASYSFEVLTNNGNTAYCNGSRMSQTTVGTDSLLTVWDLNSEIPSYLASVAVSDYTHAELEYISPVTGDTTPVWLIAQASDTVNFKSSFTAILQNIQWFEEMFGPHQYEKVGFVLVPFASGAMEHATNTELS